VPGIWRVIRRSQMHFCSNWTLQSRILPNDQGGGREFTDVFDGICYINSHSAIVSGHVRFPCSTSALSSMHTSRLVVVLLLAPKPPRA